MEYTEMQYTYVDRMKRTGIYFNALVHKINIASEISYDMFFSPDNIRYGKYGCTENIDKAAKHQSDW